MNGFVKSTNPDTNREGFALVTALLVVLVLSVLAVGVAWLAGRSSRPTPGARRPSTSSVPRRRRRSSWIPPTIW